MLNLQADVVRRVPGESWRVPCVRRWMCRAGTKDIWSSVWLGTCPRSSSGDRRTSTTGPVTQLFYYSNMKFSGLVSQNDGIHRMLDPVTEGNGDSRRICNSNIINSIFLTRFFYSLIGLMGQSMNYYYYYYPGGIRGSSEEMVTRRQTSCRTRSPIIEPGWKRLKNGKTRSSRARMYRRNSSFLFRIF